MATPAIELEGARFAWPGEDAFRLEIPSWRLEQGERLALLGASGSGKTTLLNLLAGVVRADGGAVRVLGQDLSGLSSPARDRFRGDHIGLVFQMFNLLPYASMLENVLLPLRFSARRRERAGDGAEAEARRLLSRLGLDAARLERKAVGALSVGQQQRVAAARALIGAPELIIADEPTSALDSTVQSEILAILGELRSEADLAMLIISHDLSVVARVADYVMVLYGGKVVEQGARAAVLGSAVHPYTRGLLDSVPRLDGDRKILLPSMEPGHLPASGCPFAPRCRLVVDECRRVEPDLIPINDTLAACPPAASSALIAT